VRNSISVLGSEAHRMIVFNEDSLVSLLVLSILEGDDKFSDVLDLDCDARSMTVISRELDVTMISAEDKAFRFVLKKFSYIEVSA
jgi:hypothetical protein